MQLQYIAVLAALATTVAADHVVATSMRTIVDDESISESARWYTAFSDFPTDAGDGCRDPGVPNIPRVCFDHRNGRGHFFAFGEKRCFGKDDGGGWRRCGPANMSKCLTITWNQVACTWRTEGDEIVDLPAEPNNKPAAFRA